MDNFSPINEQFATKAAEHKIKKGFFGYRYLTTGKAVKKQVEYYDLKERNYLLDCIGGTGNVNLEHRIRKSSSQVLSVVAYVEAGKNFVALQLHQYVPYMYRPITDTLFLHGEQAQQVCKALEL